MTNSIRLSTNPTRTIEDFAVRKFPLKEIDGIDTNEVQATLYQTTSGLFFVYYAIRDGERWPATKEKFLHTAKTPASAKQQFQELIASAKGK